MWPIDRHRHQWPRITLTVVHLLQTYSDCIFRTVVVSLSWERARSVCVRWAPRLAVYYTILYWVCLLYVGSDVSSEETLSLGRPRSRSDSWRAGGETAASAAAAAAAGWGCSISRPAEQHQLADAGRSLGHDARPQPLLPVHRPRLLPARQRRRRRPKLAHVSPASFNNKKT